jgi:predicted ATPase/DNA-binding XRE family transcriptional regulator
MSPEPGTGSSTSSSGFAELLRSHRLARGLTQEEFAAKAGVGVRTLRDLERDRARPQRSTVDLLLAALELDGPERLEFTLAARRGAGTDPMIEARQGVHLPPAPPLIGRDAELASLDVALRHAALVTLVGVAGVGKTSLGWTAALLAAERHPGGVAGIAISEVSTEADILATVATVFDVRRTRDLPEHLAGRPALLLVDAVERSAEPTIAAMRWLQATVPSLRMIATGRHPTRITGEYVWPVGPLEPPPPGLTELADIARYPAARLFLDRLRELGRTEIGPGDAAAVAELVRRLGGLPLALELAAARGRFLAIPEILDRYGDRVLDLGAAASDLGRPLHQGDAGTPRQGAGSTLRDAIAASYRLLEPAERWALCRLAQFRNRWSVELAEPLLADSPDGAPDIVVLLDRLTGLGLVNTRGTGAVRFRLLDMVRDFGLEQATWDGEAAEAARRHAAVLTRYAGRISGELVGRTLLAAVARLNDVSSDLRAALVWSTEHDPQTALRLAAALPRWWRFRGQDRQGREWLHRLLDDPRTADADPTVRAWAQLGLAQLAAEHGEGPAELPEVEAALATFSRYRDIAGELAARTQLCVLHQASGDQEAARRHGTAALALATRYGRKRDVVVAQNNLTWHEIRRGNLVGARRRLTAVQRLAGEVGEDRLRALAHANLAEVARLDGRYADAVAAGRRAAVQLEELGDPGQRRRTLATVGLALAESGRTAEAEGVLAELSDDGKAALIEAYLARVTGDLSVAAERFVAAAAALNGQHDVRDVVEALVGAAASSSDPRRREKLLADLDELCHRSQISLLPKERALLSG